MTTTVRVLVEGNKKCEVAVVNGEGVPAHPVVHVLPKSFAVVSIHGDQKLTVTEIGEFVS